MIRAIKLALDNAGIDMPYETQAHLLHDQTEEVDGDRSRQREGWPEGDEPTRPRAELDRKAQERGARPKGASNKNVMSEQTEEAAE